MNREQPTRGSCPDWDLGEGLVTFTLSDVKMGGFFERQMQRKMGTEGSCELVMIQWLP
jgi:hypothetical protein